MINLLFGKYGTQEQTLLDQRNERETREDLVNSILYRSKAARDDLDDSLDGNKNKLRDAYLWAFLAFVLFAFVVTILVMSFIPEFGVVDTSIAGVFVRLILFACVAPPFYYALKNLSIKRKAVFEIKGHKYLISKIARNVSVDYDIFSLVQCSIQGVLLFVFEGRSTYIAFKGEDLGLLELRSKSGSEEVVFSFVPLNAALSLSAKEGAKLPFLCKSVDMKSMFSAMTPAMYDAIDFDVPYKKQLLMAAIPCNKFVAELTEIEDPELVSLWLRNHFPSNAAAESIGDVDVAALSSLYKSGIRVYVPTQFFVSIASAYLHNDGDRYVDAYIKWLSVFTESRNRMLHTPGDYARKKGLYALLSWFKDDACPELEGYSGALLVPDFTAVVVKMIVDRVGIDYKEQAGEMAMLGYRYLYGTEQALEKYPDGKRLYLKSDLSL
ncbi:hypothetical protein [Pseudomonas sp.]|uniref:hypothetical protein n=1 Tax=Pseudomonas sp. TaxID=306 RepID=UPI002734A42D|nr:hypothetical protein [Pseudomonas sp.]MDP2745972.1 hypothetical protein [Pseudomonas sp.]